MVRLGVVGILREALGVPPRNPRLMASVLLLLSCNFLLTVPKLTLRLRVSVAPPMNSLALPEKPSNGKSPVVAEPGGPPAKVPSSGNFLISVKPLNYVVGHLSTLALVYLSAVTCKGMHTTLGALLSKVRRSWRKVAVSFLYSQIFVFTYTCLFLMVGALNLILKTHTLVLFLVLLALFSSFCVAFLIFLYLDIACRVSLVVSAVEEDKCGMAALAKAISLTRRRKLLGLVLAALCIALHRFTATGYAKMGGEKQTQIASLVVVRRFVRALVDLLVRLFVCLLWTVYYHECKESHELMGKEDRVDGGRGLIPKSCSVEGDLI